MLQVSDHVMKQFETAQTEQLAAQILAVAPALGSLEVARNYVDEALAAGISTDRDIAEFTLLLAPVDRAGRPRHVHDLVCDPQTDGALKVFQIYYALHGERP